MSTSSYIVITPVRDEAAYIGRTIESMARQTVRPRRWIVVDDGSSDESPQLVEAAAARLPWIDVIRRKDRGARQSGAGVVEAFNAGLAAIRDLPWDYLVKLDGDLSFDESYFERCLEKFAVDANLGIGGGVVCVIDQGRPRVESVGDPCFHVRGATKIYRRSCWEDIGPLVQAPGWDTIDEVRANLKGWTTRTFGDIQLIQHKPTGTADGIWRNWYKNGLANYITGYDPLFMVAKCLKRAFSTSPRLAAVALAAGFCSGYLKRRPQVLDSQAIAYLRRQQRRRLLLRSSIYG
ncbi:MAG: glycosyltransferase [Luteitalea sp.]|nr:glycosyltransferase [Luteitalea sp.]